MKAWQLIEKEENWCQGANARDQNGHRVNACHPEACKWCAGGAILTAYDDLSVSESLAAAAKLKKLLFGSSWVQADLTAWNDAPERTHAQVLAAMKKADV